MMYSQEDKEKYERRMQKADNVQKAGTEIMKGGCAIMVLVVLAIMFVVVVGAALFG